jgi:hypothetical protein
MSQIIKSYFCMKELQSEINNLPLYINSLWDLQFKDVLLKNK